MILSSPRTGTHLLRTALNSHPDVLCENEMLTTLIQRARFGNPVPIDRVFQHLDSINKPCVGFVAHKPFTSEENLLKVRDYVDRVFLLTRRNLLARYVSFLIASQKNKWTGVITNEQVSVDPHKFMKDMKEQQRFDARAAVLFPDAMQLAYEEIEDKLLEVQQFLGLEPKELLPVTIKQEKRPMSEVIINYRECFAAFAGTPLARFFMP